jgi:hypothetical protein
VGLESSFSICAKPCHERLNQHISGCGSFRALCLCHFTSWR